MSANPSGKVVKRTKLLAMLRAAQASGEHRFARQAALAWLAAFPGDIEISLLQAQAILAEKKPEQALPVIEMVYRKDPFSEAAYRLLAQASQTTDPLRINFANTSIYALGGSAQGTEPYEAWGETLRQASKALAAGDYVTAEKAVHEALRINPDLLLAAALHLLLDHKTKDTLTVSHLAQLYHERWPDCLIFNQILAETYLEQGKEPEAVQLLHLCAANDAKGQVAGRLWGDNHPYRSLWPEEMVILFDLPVPAGVAARLGWNWLDTGALPVVEPPAPVDLDEVGLSAASPTSEEPTQAQAEEAAKPETTTPAEDLLETLLAEGLLNETPGNAAAQNASEEPATQFEGPAQQNPEASADKPAGDASNGSTEAQAESETPLSSSPLRARRRERQSSPPGAIQSVSRELDRLAKSLKQPGLSKTDGRHPVYVLLSSRELLTEQYGPQTTTILENEMCKLAAIIRKRPGWDTLVYFPDDNNCTAPLGLTPVNPRDPWKVKTALADLDKALSQRGEMIGALLIVGSDPIVPFHRLPNPVEDPDGEVVSDSPYATRDKNYFVPEWPVGRLPGEKGMDAGLLLNQLRQMQRYHTRRKPVKTFLGLDWAILLRNLFQGILPAPKPSSFGYTAAVWRRSSLAVFRPIGAPHTVQTSPPETNTSLDRKRVVAARLGYYNLHGMPDSPAWYGQSDPAESKDGLDYPVAICPDDLQRNGSAPRVIFSEACYGGHILEKCEGDSLALKFLSLGTLAVVGSTCTAYGSINTPLLAADLLGNLFWQHLKSGQTAGEAFIQAKLDLVREMNRRQGYLDGEDQKTLISFVLYGDPMAIYEGAYTQSKVVHRYKDHYKVKTLSERSEDGATPAKLSSEALIQVKQLVSEYLPGGDLSEMRLTRLAVPSNGKPASQDSNHQRKNAGQGLDHSHFVVTVSKQVQVAQYVHHHIVRLALDEGGKLVKLSISR